jgi:cytochrome c oxidase subunit 3
MKSLTYSRGNPYLTMIWLSIGGSVLIFFFLAFVFLIRMHSLGWSKVDLPPAFWYSTATILLSSASLTFANRSFQRELFGQSFWWVSITLVLGLGFGLLQVAGWMALNRNGVFFREVAGAFVYLFSGLHFLHVLIGLLGLGWIWWDSYQSRTYVEGYIQSLNPQKMTRWKMVSIFWHFLDVLWIILFALLWWNQS